MKKKRYFYKISGEIILNEQKRTVARGGQKWSEVRRNDTGIDQRKESRLLIRKFRQ